MNENVLNENIPLNYVRIRVKFLQLNWVEEARRSM